MKRGVFGSTIAKACGVLLAAVLFDSCSTLSFPNISSLQKDLRIDKMPAQSDYPNSDAVMILDRTDVKMVAVNDYSYRVSKTVLCVEKIFKNIEEEAAVEIPLRPGESLLKIRGRIIEPDGETVEINPADFFVVSGEWGEGSVFYADRQRIKFTCPDVQRGSVIEYAYEEEVNLPFPSGEWDFQRDIPVMKSVYTLTVPEAFFYGISDSGANWKWNFKTYNFPDIGKPSFNRHLSQKGVGQNYEDTFTWKLSDIPAFEAEPDMPSTDLFRGYVQFAPSEWQTWNDVSSWYYNSVLKQSLNITDSVRKESEKLTEGASSEPEKIDQILRYIEGVQYGPDSAGTGNLIPDYPQTVLENQYGDEKDLVILLISLLYSAGIQAKPAFLITRSEGVIDTTFPSWRFNHVIVRAETPDERLYWLDPAVLHCRLGMIPPDDEGAVALVIKYDGTSSLDTIPQSQAWANGIFIDVKEEVRLNSASDFHVVMRFEGDDEFAMRNAFAYATIDAIRDYCKSLIANNFEYSELTDCSTSPVDSLGTYFTVSFDFQIPNLLHGNEGKYSFYADPFPAIEDLSWLGSAVRKLPVQLEYPYVVQKRVDITIADSSLLLQSIPPEVKLQTRDFVFSSAYKAAGRSHLTFQSVLVSNSREIPVERYKEAKEFFYGISKAEGEPVVLHQK